MTDVSFRKVQPKTKRYRIAVVHSWPSIPYPWRFNSHRGTGSH
jgi:hypothetical protein